MVNRLEGKKIIFDRTIRTRLERTQIECNDANKVIESRDTKDTFHFSDPPYIDTNQGHYSGYTREAFKMHLETLEKVQGKFLLSNFNSDILADFVKKNNWFYLAFDKQLSASNKSKRKTEVLVSNYEIKKL